MPLFSNGMKIDEQKRVAVREKSSYWTTFSRYKYCNSSLLLQSDLSTEIMYIVNYYGVPDLDVLLEPYRYLCSERKLNARIEETLEKQEKQKLN